MISEPIIKIAHERPPKTWEAAFKAADRELEDISRILERDESKYNYISFPPRQDIFRAFELTPLPSVKLVLVGQDPYVSVNQAHGLSFSVPKDVPVPPSLKNIYKELANSIEDFRVPNHGNLERWAKEEGILLLNQCLTVRPQQPGSHSELWGGFIYKILQAILEQNKNCIFILFGREAQKVASLMGGRGRIINCVHPSPLSAYRGFFGSGIFPLVNKYLIEDGKISINWNIDPTSS